MAILVTGSTGTIGKQVLDHLAGSGAQVRALTRAPEKAQFPQDVTAVQGALSDVDGLRRVMHGVSTLFLLAPNAADELTQALQALSVAREAGVKGVVYLSVFKGTEYTDVPHFTSKHAVERMIEQFDLPATVLRPAYFIQNDVRQKEPLLAHGVYGMPIGAKGISMVDVRDIGEAAARELLRRERAANPLPRETYELAGPDAITSEAVVSIWAEALGRTVRYGGDDLDVLEQRLKAVAPGWLAYDMRLMMSRYQQDGAVASPAEIGRLATLLGRQPRSYRDFAMEMATAWAQG
ncbi:NmrA family transcriptional regulator [Paraburkholderia ginsengiterrae]|uniref:NmrA family transcriptional regulator n=1 Tax=Paraburkholderia ginsengiterrae TaxID=1462993 RepID=A0A1A9N577_9BURK|nr:NmrA family NAD(P)-binding protein [Paraburkholderia ginsengiterrae]OAJ56938.1 NmrA family transcriptional regulator [Paraburkholderia ginsengiterrae]OAJ56995.1 NmrA family transcriptional regulator [Paraburkholderia ginsengiterrae]